MLGGGKHSFWGDVALVELFLYLLARQVRVTVGDLGSSSCVCVTSFQRN